MTALFTLCTQTDRQTDRLRAKHSYGYVTQNVLLLLVVVVVVVARCSHEQRLLTCGAVRVKPP